MELQSLKNRFGIIGNAPALNHALNVASQVANTDLSVLINGESGVGKESFSLIIHALSARKHNPFIAVNCGAIPEGTIDSELFGHEKGSFTSAIKQRIGKFESANGGTLFMDEIGDMSLSAQAKVLRALQENKVTRVGADKDINVDVRVIAATNKDLSKEIDKGNFRMDLYHRLSVIIMHVPTLNERKDDIPILAERFVTEICEEYGLPRKVITPKAMDELMSINWTGNIRELHNVMERLVILSDAKITEHEVLAYGVANVTKDPLEMLFNRFEKFVDYRDDMEKKYIEYKLRLNNWNVSKTADEIDMQRSHLYSKMEKYGLKREEVPES
jgi:two-component system, NtrC family, nitrogen regulation response regulator NtrX